MSDDVKHLRDELDEAYSQREGKVQRVGWGIMLVIILGSLLGVFGTSAFSDVTESREVAGGSVELEYPRFTRYQAYDEFDIRVHAPQAQGEMLEVRISKEIVERGLVLGVTPTADGGGLGPDGAVYEFVVDDWSNPMVVAFQFEPRKAWSIEGTVIVQAGNAPAVEFPFRSFVYP